MANNTDFSSFSKQSSKGILVLYVQQIISTLKLTWVLLFFAIKDFSKLSSIGLSYIYLSIAIVLLLLLIRAYLLYKNFQFKIENQYFILQKGILKKTYTSIPFERIQNINFKQNIIQQVINVYEVSIETAGSSETEIAIKALSLSKAKALKKTILESITKNNLVELEEKNIPLLKVSILELFKVSLTENHLRNLFLFFAIIIGFYQQIEQIAESFGETETLDGFIKDSTNAVSVSFLLIFIVLVFLTITAFITSFVRIFLVHFDLTAYLNKDDFEINQGLLTKKSIVLKKQKVQNIIVSTNPLKRLVGISYITFKQAVSGKSNGKKKEKLIRIVGCKKNQISTIKKSLFSLSSLENEEKRFPDAYYKKRIILYNVFFLMLLYSIIIYFNKYQFLWSIFLVVPVISILIYKKLKKRFYKISDDMLLVGHGLLETHITYLELFKLQNIKLKQSFFQKKNNVADVVLQTASGEITVPCIEYKNAILIFNYMLYKVESSTKEWM